MLWPCGPFQPRTLSQTHILSSVQTLPPSKIALPEFSHSVLPVQTLSLRGKVLKISWFHIQRGSSWVSHTVRNLPSMQETWVQSLGPEDPLEKGMATHSNILDWRIPWTEKPGGLQSMDLRRAGHDWATNTHAQERGKVGSSVFDMLNLNLTGHVLGHLSRKLEYRNSRKSQDCRARLQSHSHLEKT